MQGEEQNRTSLALLGMMYDEMDLSPHIKQYSASYVGKRSLKGIVETQATLFVGCGGVKPSYYP